MTLPAKPLITPCHHIFCGSCIQQALRHQSICPIDRQPCRVDQLKSFDGALSRIWGAIQVKCGGCERGCAWRGSIADYAVHAQHHCTIASASNNTIARRADADREQQLQAHIIQVQAERDTLKVAVDLLSEEKRNAETIIENLNAQLSSRPNVPTLFHGHYNFRREHVVQLSQLISRYLECKPHSIDSNKIYNCVRACVMDLEKNYSDNPEHYFVDMRMLLATCLASTWFSDNQRRSLKQWYGDHFSG
ncbi:hypothetical protein ACHAWT_006569 [Skeletonema menzelii]